MDSVDEIKNRLDLKDVVTNYVKLEKSGVNFRTNCPFHNEKTPSFFVSPTRQTWRCFGCGLGGDMFTFIEQIEGVEFTEALRMLAQKAGVELRRQDPKLKSERDKSLEICELTAKYFHHQLESKNGRIIAEYLESRGINKQSIEEFQLGYAPLRGSSLVEFLNKRGYKNDELLKAGVVFKSEQTGEYITRFRGRIIFPIFDHNGNCIAFGARQLSQELATSMNRQFRSDDAKYINSPQTNIYDKGKVLYGLDKAKIAIRQNDACVVAEGYTDVILAHQTGYKNVVSASGTALTEHQLKLINRFTQNLITAFDMDTAGDTATRRGISMAQAMGFDVRIIVMPQGKDPADLIKDSPKEWEEATEKAKSITEFYFESVFTKHDASAPEGKRNITKELAPVIKSIANKVEQAHWVQELAGKLDVTPQDVWDEVRKSSDMEHITLAQEEIKKNNKQISRKQLLAQQILLHALKNKKLLPKLEKFLQEFEDSQIEEFKILHTIINNKNDTIKDILKDQKHKILVDNLLFEAEIKKGEWTSENLSVVLDLYKKLVLEEKLSELEKQITNNEKQGNLDKVEDLLKEFHELITS